MLRIKEKFAPSRSINKCKQFLGGGGRLVEGTKRILHYTRVV